MELRSFVPDHFLRELSGCSLRLGITLSFYHLSSHSAAIPLFQNPPDEFRTEITIMFYKFIKLLVCIYKFFASSALCIAFSHSLKFSKQDPRLVHKHPLQAFVQISLLLTICTERA